MPAPTDTRFFDVWIIERNTVYQKVPFTVVADWLQEGRLLEGDKVRPAGTTVWQRLGEHPLLMAYLPKEQPTHAEDTAEGLQSIELDFPGKPQEKEDDDVDMIPLIDISMVLLVFFMMTAQNLLSASPVSNPEAKAAKAIISRGLIVVTMMSPGGGKVEYFVGESVDKNKPLTEEQCIKEVEAAQKASKAAKVVLQAEKTLSYDKVQALSIKLEKAGVKYIQAKVKHVGGRVDDGGGEGSP